MTGVSHIFFSKKTLKKGCFKELWSCFNASQLKTIQTKIQKWDIPKKFVPIFLQGMKPVGVILPACYYPCKCSDRR